MKFKVTSSQAVFNIVSGKIDTKHTSEIPEGLYLAKEITPMDNTGTWYQVMGKECVFCINHNITPKDKFFIIQQPSALLAT